MEWDVENEHRNNTTLIWTRQSNPQWNWNAKAYIIIIIVICLLWIGICTIQVYCTVVRIQHFSYLRTFSANAENYPKYSQETVCIHFIENWSSSRSRGEWILYCVLFVKIMQEAVELLGTSKCRNIYALLSSHFWVSLNWKIALEVGTAHTALIQSQ